MRFPPFTMERWQSTFEHRVDYNLSESGVHPLTLSQLCDLTGLEPDSVLLGYTQSDGSDELRHEIAALYDGATAENVVCTTGGAEANFVVLWTLVSAGDRVVVVEPTYGQTPGLAVGLGAEVVSVPLEESRGWQPAPGALEAAITPGTRLVIVTNPSNPTGVVLSDEARAELVSATSSVGAWLLADEVYAGAEVEGPETPSLFGGYERVMVTGSLSKAYGLPGLRLGWIAAPVSMREELWGRKDYLTITPSALSDAAAASVMRPDARDRILKRTREIIRSNLPLLRDWFDARSDMFAYTAPDAGAICYVRYLLDINSTDLAEQLRAEQSVLVVPGDHFGMDRYLRIGFGNPADDLEAGLERIADHLLRLRTA